MTIPLPCRFRCFVDESDTVHDTTPALSNVTMSTRKVWTSILHGRTEIRTSISCPAYRFVIHSQQYLIFDEKLNFPKTGRVAYSKIEVSAVPPSFWPAPEQSTLVKARPTPSHTKTQIYVNYVQFDIMLFYILMNCSGTFSQMKLNLSSPSFVSNLNIPEMFSTHTIPKLNKIRPGHGFSRLMKTHLLAPVPLSIFRSNSKFVENSKHSSVRYSRPITTISCTRHDSVQHIVVIGWVYSKLERSEFSSNFEFDRDMLSGTGALSNLKERRWVNNALLSIQCSNHQLTSYGIKRIGLNTHATLHLPNRHHLQTPFHKEYFRVFTFSENAIYREYAAKKGPICHA